MQLNIRTNGSDHMSPDAYAKFTSLHTSGSLLPPSWYVPASSHYPVP